MGSSNSGYWTVGAGKPGSGGGARSVKLDSSGLQLPYDTNSGRLQSPGFRENC